MWTNVNFLGTVMLAWVPSLDLWQVLSKTPQPTEQHILAQIADDGPFRWVLPATQVD